MDDVEDDSHLRRGMPGQLLGLVLRQYALLKPEPSLQSRTRSTGYLKQSIRPTTFISWRIKSFNGFILGQVLTLEKW